MARILAREFGADEWNVVEINAASKRGIDMARDLERFSTASPIGGNCRAVILDEAHQLTKDAQGALLKTLEDVPDFAYYMLCTTDPHKLLPTIKTRCEKIEVAKLNDEDMDQLLIDAVERGKLPAPHDDVLDAIIENSGGCPREAVAMLEKQNGLPREEAVRVVHQHLTHEKALIDVCRAVVAGKWAQVLSVYKRIESPEPENVRHGVLGYLRAMLLKGGTNVVVDAIEELAEPTWNGGEPQLLAQLYRATGVFQ